MAISITRSGEIARVDILGFEEDDISLLKNFYETMVNNLLINKNPEKKDNDYNCEQKSIKGYATVDDSEKVEVVTSAEEFKLPPLDPVEDTEEEVFSIEEVYEDSDDKNTYPFPSSSSIAIDTKLDSEGLPWDARIHSGKKSKTSDGKWRLVRGITPEMVQVVKSELRATMAIPAPAPQVPPTPASIPVPTPMPPVPPAPTAIPGSVLFAGLINLVTESIGRGKLTQEKLIEVCRSEGLPSLPAANSRPDLIPAIEAKLKAIIGV